MSYSGFEKLISNEAYQIYFYSYSTARSFIFPAYVTDYSDSFKSNWTSQEIYGKMDPIVTFKNTARSINLSFDIPNEDLKSAISNLSNLDNLIKGLYPIYTDTRINSSLGVSTLTAPPLFSIKFANLIINVQNGKPLLGYLNGFDFKPDFTVGHFINDNKIYPKLVKASLTFNVIHQHPLGNMMHGDKPVPRIVLENNNITNGYAHNFNTSQINAQPAPPPSGSTTGGAAQTQLELYVQRKLEAGTALPGYSEADPRIGPIVDVSRNPFTPSGGHKESFKDMGDYGDGRRKFVNVKTGEIILLPVASSGGSLEYFGPSSTEPVSPDIGE